MRTAVAVVPPSSPLSPLTGPPSRAHSRPRAGEDRRPVAAGVVASRAQGERLAPASDRVRPGPQRVSVRAKATLVVLRVRRVVNGRTHLHAPARPVADVEERAAAAWVAQLPSRRADLETPAAG